MTPLQHCAQAGEFPVDGGGGAFVVFQGGRAGAYILLADAVSNNPAPRQKGGGHRSPLQRQGIGDVLVSGLVTSLSR